MDYLMTDFELTSDQQFSAAFREVGVHSFVQACQYVARLPYGRNANRSDFELVLSEGKGTCSSKHALLAFLANENAQDSVELMVGIFLMSPETHPQLAAFFEQHQLTVIPEAHCYLRIEGKRFDFTTKDSSMERIESKIVREQRVEPNQVIDWKIKIHQDYISKWLQRNPQITYDFDTLWQLREEMIAQLAILDQAN